MSKSIIDCLFVFSVSGLFNSFFLAIYSCTNCCYLMKFCYRSVDEVFGVFISIAFVIDAIKSCKHIHDDYYRSCPIINATSATLANATTESAIGLFNLYSYFQFFYHSQSEYFFVVNARSKKGV